MTRAQQALYRGKGGLWPEACRVQGWDPADEDKRRAVTLEAARKVNPTSTCNTTRDLNQDQITALFTLLRAYANPLDLAAQRASENPDETRITDQCRRVCYAINEFGFDRNYVQKIADWKCRVHQVRYWEHLPLHELRQLVITVERRAAAKHQPRRWKDAPKDYELLPRRTWQRRETTNIPN